MVLTMLKYISPRVDAVIFTEEWHRHFNSLGDSMIVEGYSVDIIELSGAATELEYYA